MIYLIRCKENVKVGYTSLDSVESRVSSMQTGNPFKLEVVGTYDGTVSEERSLHELLSKYHVRGEWFRMCDEVMSIVSGYMSSEEKKKRLDEKNRRRAQNAVVAREAKVASLTVAQKLEYKTSIILKKLNKMRKKGMGVRVGFARGEYKVSIEVSANGVDYSDCVDDYNLFINYLRDVIDMNFQVEFWQDSDEPKTRAIIHGVSMIGSTVVVDPKYTPGDRARNPTHGKVNQNKLTY